MKDYVFDLDRMVSFDGNTAGYCQYAYARARSVLRKSDGVPARSQHRDRRARRARARARAPRLRCASFATSSERSNHIGSSSYIYALATAFTTFYDACPILKAEPTLRASRLALTELAARTMACGLGLLGISVPERM